MKKLVILAMMFVMGCTDTQKDKVACAVETAIENSTSSIIAAKLTCTNLEAIKVAVQSQVDKLKLCKADTAPAPALLKSPIGDLVCAPLATNLISLINSQIPSEWDCANKNVATDLVKQAILEACQKSI